MSNTIFMCTWLNSKTCLKRIELLCKLIDWLMIESEQMLVKPRLTRLCPPRSRLPRRRRVFTDRPEHRGDLPRDKQFHHLRGLDDHPSVLRDGHMDPDEQARVSDSHAGELHWAKPNKAEHDSLSSGGISCQNNVFGFVFPATTQCSANFYSTTFHVVFPLISWQKKRCKQNVCGLGFSDKLDTF